MSVIDLAVSITADRDLSEGQRVSICRTVEELLGELRGPDGISLSVDIALSSRFHEAERLLAESLIAWEGEEDSVREEHSELIASLASFLGRQPDAAPPDPVRSDHLYGLARMANSGMSTVNRVVPLPQAPLEVMLLAIQGDERASSADQPVLVMAWVPDYTTALRFYRMYRETLSWPEGAKCVAVGGDFEQTYVLGEDGDWQKLEPSKGG